MFAKDRAPREPMIGVQETARHEASWAGPRTPRTIAARMSRNAGPARQSEGIGSMRPACAPLIHTLITPASRRRRDSR